MAGGTSVAHLIKLEDYNSRYQLDLHRYPSQYTRMKKERWFYLKSEWEQSEYARLDEDEINEVAPKKDLIKLALKRFKSWSHQPRIEDSVTGNITLDQLKDKYMDDLFKMQIKWASSSSFENASGDAAYVNDKWLRFFAQTIPDNYFLMYKPVFYLKKAPIDFEVLLVGPTEIICISIIEGQEHSVFEAGSGKFWTEYINESRKRRISPLLSLTRMTGVIKTLLDTAELSFPIRQVVLNRESIIDNKMQGVKAEFIDRRKFGEWLEALKKNPSPIKSQQMRISALLLLNSTKPEVPEEEEEERDNQ